jgi:uncharacterized protein YndB with AHSA1/START domain
LELLLALADGTELRERGVYREIVEAKKLSFTYAADQSDGNPGHQTLERWILLLLGARPESLFAKGLLNRSWPAMSMSAAGRAVWSVSPST